jgi:hypothetical protein
MKRSEFNCFLVLRNLFTNVPRKTQLNVRLCSGVNKLANLVVFFRETKLNHNSLIFFNIGRQRDQNITAFWSSKILFTNVLHKTLFNKSLLSGVNKFADITVFFVERNKTTTP